MSVSREIPKEKAEQAEKNSSSIKKGAESVSREIAKDKAEQDKIDRSGISKKCGDFFAGGEIGRKAFSKRAN